MTEPMIVDLLNAPTTATTLENTNPSQATNELETKKFSIKDVPRLPRELTPFARFTNTVELDQRGPLFQGSGAKRETGRYKIRVVDDDNVKRAKKFALEQSVKYVLAKQQQHQQRAQLDVMKKQQALLLMRRIYVGSINFELNEAMLKQAFQPFGPVKAVSLAFDTATNRHRGFAFLEYETPEAAQLAMEQMNGVVLSGRNIIVGRPSNMPQAQPIIDQLTEEAKNYNRIYIASIHPDLTETDIQSIFEPFGVIKSCTLGKDSATSKHKGYGFIEYETIQAAHDAINSMNLFDLGGQHLRVGKAMTPPDGIFPSAQASAGPMPTATALAVATITAQLQAKDLETNPQPTASSSPSISSNFATSPVGKPNTSSPARQTSVQPSPVAVPLQTPPLPPPVPSLPQPTLLEEPPIPAGLQPEPADNKKPVLSLSNADDSTTSLSQQEGVSVKGREQRHLLMQKLNQRRLESRVCLLKNMVGHEDVDDDLQQEISEECSKYGEVVKVVIYTEQQGEEDHSEQIVKIFVEFQTSKQAEKTVHALNGRHFAGRVIKAELYDQTAYQADDLSG